MYTYTYTYNSQKEAEAINLKKWRVSKRDWRKEKKGKLK